jgi:urease accessory protein
MKFIRSASSALLFIATASAGWAHPGHGPHFGAAAGFLHPLTGWDHALAMIAVGFWAAQLGAPLLLPGTFLALLTVGAGLGHWTGPITGLEQGVAASILVLGLLIEGAIQLPTAVSVALIGLFALFHGAAHGAEMPASADALQYGLGFVAASALLHLVGIAISSVASGRFSLATRIAGVGIAVAGVILLAN